MRHAEAHERLADLALEPGRLLRFEQDPSPELEELRAHVQTCSRCAADLAGWRRTWSEAGPALAERGPVPVLLPPGGLRDRILDAAQDHRDAAPASRAGEQSDAKPGEPVGAGPAAQTRGQRTSRTAGSGRSMPGAWLAVAAAIVIATSAATSGWLRQGEVDELRGEAARLQAEVEQLRTETGELREVAAAFDRILANQRHWVVTLRTADGVPGGTLAWTASEIVMVAGSLPAPASGQVYRCWVEDPTGRTPMGPMAMTGSTGYWVSSMAPWSDAAWADAVVPGLRFGVSLAPFDGAGTPVLIGSI
jgi:hypothetical protein